VTSRGRLFAQLGLALSIMAALTLVGDYFVQLAVIQPSLRAGEADGISLLTQYNPHGLFIALEELGYLLMSLSLVCMIPALSRSTRLERVIRWLFLIGFVVNLLALFWFLLRYGHDRAMRRCWWRSIRRTPEARTHRWMPRSSPCTPTTFGSMLGPAGGWPL
jgi:hypothetical protein